MKELRRWIRPWLPHGPYGAPKSSPTQLGDDHSDDDDVCEVHKKAREFVALGWLIPSHPK